MLVRALVASMSANVSVDAKVYCEFGHQILWKWAQQIG